jgi:hypothetical protein
MMGEAIAREVSVNRHRLDGPGLPRFSVQLLLGPRPRLGAGSRRVFAADSAAVTDAVDMAEQAWVVDLAGTPFPSRSA